MWAGTKITRPVLPFVELALVACATSDDVIPLATTPNANAVNQQMAVFRNTDCPFCYVHAVAPLDAL
jgi:hypothetical protein